MTRTLLAALLAATVWVAAGASPSEAAKQPLVVVVRHGGLCPTGECRSVFRITDKTISDEGNRRRALTSTERRALIRAIGDLSAAYLRRHPFKGICPTAYDASESIYRFRGFTPSIPSCKYDVHGLQAVRLTERLLATLKPIR